MAEKIWPNKEKPPVKTEGLSHYGLVTNRLQEVLNHSHSMIDYYLNSFKINNL